MKIIEKTKEKGKKISKEFRFQTVAAISGALGFLIALSWRDAISDIIKKITEPLTLSNLFLYKIITAIIVTFICVIGIIFLAKWSSKLNK